MATPLLTTRQTATASNTFERMYIEAKGDASRIPWADQRPHPALVNWLNATAPSLVRSGSRVCVVGCGLGDDARELLRRGYEVCAFDCSPTAINWAKQLDPKNEHVYNVADLFDLPTNWRHRFDLVVEVNTIQSLPPDAHEEAMQSIATLMARHGRLLVIARCQDAPYQGDGPPFPLTEEELLHIAGGAGLQPSMPPAVFMDDEDPPVKRIRALFERA